MLPWLRGGKSGCFCRSPFLSRHARAAATKKPRAIPPPRSIICISKRTPSASPPSSLAGPALSGPRRRQVAGGRHRVPRHLGIHAQREAQGLVEQGGRRSGESRALTQASIVWPPSITSAWPVTNDDSSDARNKTP